MTYHYLNTADESVQRNFWCNILAGRPVENGFQIPGAVILLSSKTPSAGTAGSVLDHVGLQVNNLAEIKDRLTRSGILFEPNPNGTQAMVTAPDGLRVELSENKQLATSAAFHHYHFYTVDVPAIQRWYAETLGAVPGRRAQFDAADLPGINFTFSPTDVPRAPTAGRALDRIGFDAPRAALLTDPWGTGIELRT